MKTGLKQNITLWFAFLSLLGLAIVPAFADTGNDSTPPRSPKKYFIEGDTLDDLEGDVVNRMRKTPAAI